MPFRPASLGWLAALASIAACHRADPSPPAAVVVTRPASLADADPGASLLAEVENARAALGARDEVAAVNDVSQALSFAVSLSDASSDVYPAQTLSSNDAGGGSGGGGSAGGGGHHHGQGGGGSRRGHGGAPPAQAAASPTAASTPPAGRHHAHGAGQPPIHTAAFTAFDAQVRLTSAQAKLEAHDMHGADAELAAIQGGAVRGAVPADLPLLRADQSLALAETALAGGEPAELRTQLANASEALGAYTGPAHVDDARTLAATIDALLRRPGGLASLEPELVSSWSNRIDGWA